MKQVGPSEPLVWRGYRLELMPQKAVWDPQQRLLLAADLHLGKAECLQPHGIALPSDGDASTLNALLSLVHRCRPKAVVVLGDLIHSRLGLTEELRQKIRALPELMGCPLTLIGGNHERGSWLDGLSMANAQPHGPWWLSHAPDPQEGRLNLCGHRHPVAVVGNTVDRLRLPCFAFDPQTNVLTLPAFGHLTGGHPCSPREQVWLVAEGQVWPWQSGPSRPRPGHAPRRLG